MVLYEWHGLYDGQRPIHTCLCISLHGWLVGLHVPELQCDV